MAEWRQYNKLLTELYSETTVAELVKVLPFTKAAIYRQASKLGLRKTKKFDPSQYPWINFPDEKVDLETMMDARCMDEHCQDQRRGRLYTLMRTPYCQRCGQLEVNRRATHDCELSGCANIKKFCNKCETTKPLSEFETDSSRGGLGHRTCCRDCKSIRRRADHAALRQREHDCAEAGCASKLKYCRTCTTEHALDFFCTAATQSSHHSLSTCRVRQYIKGANNRGLKWSLTSTEAILLLNSPCHYCGVMPNPYNGIDRMNSQCGYESDNCVPCCSGCNYAKRGTSYEEFLCWINRLVEFRSK